MAFAAAVMSTSAGHKAFIRSPSHEEILDSYSRQPATPPRSEPITPPTSQQQRPAFPPRTTSNNSNSSNKNTAMNSPNTDYMSQFNTALSSFKPRSPPGMHSYAQHAIPDSPVMIRCSTCNSQVPLMELSDHVCRPPAAPATSTSAPTIPLHNPRQAPQPSQHARLASGFNQAVPTLHTQPAARNMLNPLRVNVSQAYLPNGQQLEAPLPTPYRTPLPRSPSDYSRTPSPGVSPAGSIPSLSPSYPFERQQQSHRRHPISGPESEQQTSPISAHSPSSKSDIVDLSAENNAGIGARMPFYERLQQQRAFVAQPTSPSFAVDRPSLAVNGPQLHTQSAHHQQDSLPHSAGSYNQPWAKRMEAERMGDGNMPKSPITPGWSGLANHEPEIFREPEEKPRRSEEPHCIKADDGENSEDHKVPSAGPVSKLQEQRQHHHMRETSDSGQSSAALSNSYSDHLDYFINDGSTPDTSPEFPDTPLFKDNNDPSGSCSSSSIGRFGLQQNLARGHEGKGSSHSDCEEEEEDYQGYDDDIIDSYPTPQPSFSGRFGGLVIDDDDDDAMDAYHRSQAPPAAPPHIDNKTNFGGLAPTTSSPLLRAHSDRCMQDRAHPHDINLKRGISSSASIPNNLARLASIDTSVAGQDARSPSTKMDESAIPFNGRGRKRSNNLNGRFSPSEGILDARRSSKDMSPANITPTEVGGLRLDACIDDLMKEMNRESTETLPAGPSSALKSPLSHASDYSITPTSPEAQSSGIPFITKQETQVAKTKKDVQCDSCNQIIRTNNPVERDGQCFCSECYAQLYLPKCRKCRLPIEDKAIGSGDGKVKGKFHIGCFSCFSCSAPFPTGDFYVFDNRPYCAQHYHERNGTLCANPACSEEQQGIEGPCVSLVGEENGNGGRYHPACFRCTEGACLVLLDQYHYVLNGLPYCEQHAREIEDRDNAPVKNRSASPPPTNPGESDDLYNLRYNGLANSSLVEEKRRSASLPVQSLNALRKNAQAPNYRGMLARRRGSARRRLSESSGNVNGWDVNGRNQLPVQQPSRTAGAGNDPSIPPISRTRRAEKRRTVISQMRLH